jgi:hypothetical protein
MYKLTIDLADWSWDEDQKVTVETIDFEKAQIIQEFIEFQKDHGWAADYELSEEYVANQCDEEDEVEDEVEDEEVEYSVGDMVEDEDGYTWIFLG